MEHVRLGIFRYHPQYYANLVEFPPENSEGVFITHWARDRLSAELKARQCNLLFANQCWYPNLFFTRNKPVLGDLEGHFQGYSSKTYPPLEKRVGNPKIKKIIAQSWWAYNDAMCLIKNEESRAKIEVVYHAWRTDLHKNKRSDDEVRFFFIGETFFLKGADWAVEAFKELYKKYDNIRLVIVSNNFSHLYYWHLTGQKLENHPWSGNLNQYLDHPGITFIPKKISADQKLEFYANSDVFVFPTKWETFGCVFLEAMAHSLPIITGNYGPLPEVVHENQNAFLLKTADKSWTDLFNKTKIREELIGDLKDYMEQLIVSKSLRNKMGRASYKLMEQKYSIETRNKKMRKIYDEITV